MSFMSVWTCEFSNPLQKHNQMNYWFMLLHQKAEILKSINGCCRWKRATCLSVCVSVSWHWFSKPSRRFFHHESSLYGIHQHLIVCMMSTGTKWLEIPSTWQIIWLSHKRRQVWSHSVLKTSKPVWHVSEAATSASHFLSHFLLLVIFTVIHDVCMLRCILKL